MVVAGRDTELSLLTTTRKVDVVGVHLSELLHSLHPVGVVVPVLILAPALVVVKLSDVGSCI